jgi:hypothetical protein
MACRIRVLNAGAVLELPAHPDLWTWDRIRSEAFKGVL